VFSFVLFNVCIAVSLMIFTKRPNAFLKTKTNAAMSVETRPSAVGILSWLCFFLGDYSHCLLISILRCYVYSKSLVPVPQQIGHFLGSGLASVLGSAFSLSSRALMATITVLADINTAPRAGVSSTPHA